MNYLSPEEAVEHILHNHTIGISGFTSAGAPRTIAHALAKKANKLKVENKPFKVNIIAGASTCSEFDAELSKAHAINYRMPYQGNKLLREAINQQQVSYIDVHLSQVSEQIHHGWWWEIDVALVEVSEILSEDRVVLTTAVGITPTICKYAKKIILEINDRFPHSLHGLHDLPCMDHTSGAGPLTLTQANQRIGETYITIDPKKVIGVVHSSMPVEEETMSGIDPVTQQIGEHISQFLMSDASIHRMHAHSLPIQVGVGNVANAVFHSLFESEKIKDINMYSEVLQDSTLDGLLNGRIRFASGGCLPTSQQAQHKLWHHFSELRNKILLRPMDITNHPDIIRRLGVIAINTALEADIWGNVNSTHVCGSRVINGIGGSADFSRNAYISIFATPSVAKGGSISAIVPMCSHVDQIDHDVDVLVTEHGLADLRGKDPLSRAKEIITNCAHPMYKDALMSAINYTSGGHMPINLDYALSFHKNYINTGHMLGQ